MTSAPLTGSGACGVRVWLAGSRVDVVRVSARRLLMEGRMKDVKISVRGNVVLRWERRLFSCERRSVVLETAVNRLRAGGRNSV